MFLSLPIEHGLGVSESNYRAYMVGVSESNYRAYMDGVSESNYRAYMDSNRMSV